MAHFRLPSGEDPDTVRWLSMPRKRRRAARAEANLWLKLERRDLTKAQRRAATPWRPILVSPSDALHLSGRANPTRLAQVRAGLNRAARRAMDARNRRAR